MRIIRHWNGVAPDARGASLAIGNFDGIHLGHQGVIDAARMADAPLGVLTFEPHPRQFFAPDAPAFRLMNPEARAHRLEKLGVDLLFEVPFDREFASLSAEGFVRRVLVEGLGVRRAATGADFCFGKGRSGSVATLRELGALHGFDVVVAPTRQSVDGLRHSSTAIRGALSAGRPREAAAILGHWHRIEGEVIHGEKRGRVLGYPTANMDLTGLHLPHFGVYAVLADVKSGPHAGSYHGAASIGVRPMFGRNTPNLETFLFDFSGDLYGAHMSVGLVEFLRPEESFADIPALVAQMTRDCARARAVLGAL